MRHPYHLPCYSLLLFILFFIQSANARTTPDLYLQLNKVFNTSEIIYISLTLNHNEKYSYNYNYSYNAVQNNANVRMALYKINNVANLFIHNNIDFNKAIPDTIFKELKLIKSWDETTSLNTSKQVKVDKQSEGVYLLEAIYQNYVVRMPLFVSNYGILTRIVGEDALAFAANSKDGKALPQFSAYIKNYGSQTLQQATNYKKGIAHFSKPVSPENYENANNLAIIILYGDNKATVSNAFLNNYNNTLQSRECKGYVFTDRPVYRPLQPVRFQGIFRERVGRVYNIVQDTLLWFVRNPLGQEIAKGRVKLDKNGNFSDSILLDEKAALGSWNIAINLKEKSFSYNAQFSVEEYKKPEFIVAAKTDKNQYKAGDKIGVNIEAKYFFGSPVANAEVIYQVVKKPLQLAIPQYNYQYRWMNNSYITYNNYNISPQETIVTKGKTKLDKNGKCRISFTSDYTSKSNDDYTIIAYVMDASRRSISASANFIVAYDDIQITAWTEKNYYKPGEEVIIHARSADFSGNASKAKVNASLFLRRGSNKEDKKVSETDVLTNSATGEAIIKFKIKEAGNYYTNLKAWETDNSNAVKNYTSNYNNTDDSRPVNILDEVKLRPATSTLNLTIQDTASAFKMWYNNPAERFSIRVITDKKQYKHNEKISALVYLPFGADAFITVNNNLLGNYNTYSFPGSKNKNGQDSGSCREIKIDFLPDLAGQVHFYVAAMYNGYFQQQIQQITVLPETKMLNVDVIFDKAKYKPGTKAKARIKVTDHQEKAVSNANISLGTVDESIYAMSADKTPDIRKVFHGNEQPIQAVSYLNNNNMNVYVKGTEMSAQSIDWRLNQLGNNFSKKTYMGNNNYYQLLQIPSNYETLEGYIISYETGLAIPHAEIRIGGSSFYADKDGYYLISGFNPQAEYIDLDFIHKNNKLSFFNLKLNNSRKTTLNVAIQTNSDLTFELNPKENIRKTAAFAPYYWQRGIEMAGNISISQNNDVSLKIKIRDVAQNQSLNHASIRLYDENGSLIYNCVTDENGECNIRKVKQGNYILSAAYLGFKQQFIEAISFTDKKSMEIKIAMKEYFMSYDAKQVEVTGYRKPLFEKDMTTSGSVITREEIQRSPYRTMNQMSATVPGVYTQNSNDFTFSGNHSYSYNNEYKVREPEQINIPTDALRFNEATVRENFRDVIFWDNTITTNENGEAEIEINIPDNLTGWQTTAKVITPDAKVGQAIANIIVRKELLVRMETPRFITHGDTLLIATNVHNYLDKEKTVKVILQADGLKLNGTEKLIKIPAGGEKRIDWKVEAKTITKAKLTVKALTDEESDAMLAEVPVLPYGLQVSEQLMVDMNGNKSKKINFEIPKEIDIKTAKLEVNVSPSIAAAMLSSMNSLIGYPYGCVEQTMSRFIPLVLAVNTLKTLGQDYEVCVSAEELKKMVATGSNRLAELQNQDGSWGWWSKDQQNPFMTAYVCYGLNLAKRAGYDVPEAAYQKGLNSLIYQIKNGSKTDAQSYAYQVMVATQCGLKDIWKTHKKMPDAKDNAYTKALWLQAAVYAEDIEMKKALVKELENSAIQENGIVSWTEKMNANNNYYYSNWQNDPVEATANSIKALTMADPDNKLIAPAARWIMQKRAGNSWHNTRQTAMCIFALNELIKKELKADYKLDLFANNKAAGTITVSGKDVFKEGKTLTFTSEKLFAGLNSGISTDSSSVLHYGSNSIEVKQQGEGHWYLSAKLNYYLNLDDKYADKLTAIQKDNLFGVERSYYKISSKRDVNRKISYKKQALDKNAIKPGDDILVKVKVYAKSRQDYVLIEDPIPAGCEFIRDTKGYIISGENEYNGRDFNNNYKWYNHREMRDDKLALMITTLNTGTYEYSYLIKAQIPGNYRVAPAVAQLMYYPEKRGFSNFFKLVIKE